MTDQIKLPKLEPEAYIWSPLMSRKKFLDFDLPDVECHYEPLFTADQVRAAVLEERTKILDALRGEINHCAYNDLRMMPAFGRVKGDPGIPATYIDAVIERFGGDK